MSDRFARLGAAAAIKPEESQLAWRIGGALYLIGAVTLAAFTVLPDVPHGHRAVILTLAGAALAWGLSAILVIDFRRAPWWLMHATTTAGLIFVGIAISATGGARSTTWIYLFLVVVFAAYFFPPAFGLTYLAGAIAVSASVLLYDPRALSGVFLAQFVIAAPTFVALASAIIVLKRFMAALRWRAEELAAEHGALRRVATAVVGGEPTERLYELVAREAGMLLGASAAGLLRLENPGSATVLGSWARADSAAYPPGTIVALSPNSGMAQTLRTGRPARTDDHGSEGIGETLHLGCSVVSPVTVAGRIWGALAVATTLPWGLSSDCERRLNEFGDLLATAISSIEDRAQLKAQARTDPLTGLANHRMLHERLAAETTRAARHGTPLSVAVLDVDHFKTINDTGGHDSGDEMLVRVANCLRSVARAGDTLARAGGDEFAWLLPQTTGEQALAAVQRARQIVGESVELPLRLSLSVGICDTSVSCDPAQLLGFADDALYACKAHGRAQARVYDPGSADQLSAQDRAERLERSRVMVGLRALARAVDAQDPGMAEHSQRVSQLVTELARRAGWTPARALMLGEAALVHDIGKIAVADEHPAVAARILNGVLDAEQLHWIRAQHERPDGRGYPDGLREDEIPQGAALLALADAWDVMTLSRPSSARRTPQEALAECQRLIGVQFSAAAVRALIAVRRTDQPDRRPAGSRLRAVPAEALILPTTDEAQLVDPARR
jgi:diguanylate cyclase (GGDEF)-like protein